MGVHRVVAVAVPEAVAFDLSIPAQVFGHRDEREIYGFSVCSFQAGPVATTTAGFSINASTSLASMRRADTVIVPGFVPTQRLPSALGTALRSAYARGARIVSICTGAFALAEAGLLDGRSATTHWRDAQELARAYPAVDVQPDVLYIDDGQVLTSAGVAAGIDLCLHLVRTDHGAEAATRIAAHGGRAASRRRTGSVHRPADQRGRADRT